MYIIIAGCGRFGTELATRFSDCGHDVVMIDSNPDRFQSLGPGFNGATVTGMPFDEDVLQQAGIMHADVVAAVTDDDNINVMISQVAKMLYHTPRVLTRISTPRKINTFKKMGFDVICPATAAANIAETRLTQSPQKEASL